MTENCHFLIFFQFSSIYLFGTGDKTLLSKISLCIIFKGYHIYWKSQSFPNLFTLLFWSSKITANLTNLLWYLIWRSIQSKLLRPWFLLKVCKSDAIIRKNFHASLNLSRWENRRLKNSKKSFALKFFPFEIHNGR